jgi:hypothetical protein
MEIEHFTAQWENQTKTWHIEKNKKGAFQSYFFHDDLSKIFFSDFFVQKEFREEGVGLELIKYHHGASKYLGFKESFLGVEKGSWMENWYKRLGYEFYEEKDENENWLVKKLV